MAQIHVFAGLGSEALFSDPVRKQATRDSSIPRGKVLLETCHQTFIDEVLLALAEDPLLRLDLDDFKETNNLLHPKKEYYRHPIVQNATLCLVQLLRYQSRALRHGKFGPSFTRAVSGFCVGQLAAAAVATSQDALQFLTRAEQCFRVAVLVGIASERARAQSNILRGVNPWSVIITNTSAKEMRALAGRHGAAVAVSAINGPTCVTISGQGGAVKAFVTEALPQQCSSKLTNIFSPYHDSRRLAASHEEILHKLAARKIDFPSIDDLLIPVVSNIDGSLIQQSSAKSQSLLGQILDMVLISPTDWVAVQETLLAFATDCAGLLVENYGPGYGALNGRKDLPLGLSVKDVSTQDQDDSLSSEDIAIVGVGINLPGAADLDTLWQNLINSINSCTEIPTERFHVEDYYTKGVRPPVNGNRTMDTKYGNFIDTPFEFDHQLFGISPREASSIDPQQRIVLQTVYRALEHAGYVPDSTASFARDTFGCFIGNATLDYVDNLRNDIDVYYSPGTLRAFVSGRVSYAFKWSGPCATLDTACSSSLVAIYQAARALAAGDCRAAVAGGVNVITSPEQYIGLDKAHFLSPSGQCKAFDETADGYCRSDGCATFVLKRLCDAVAENDRILGVIKGIEVNQSGKASSITHPHSGTQDKLFRRLVSRANIDPHCITVAEAHGTGTQAGDPNELRSIRSVFADGRSANNPLYVSSIKSNIGHAEAASGGAGLAKLLMMLKHKTIPPQALLRKLNPAIDELGVDGTLISTESREWRVQANKKRVALLNNFGAAGSNAALLLQEYEEPFGARPLSTEPLTYVFGCSARTPELLEQARQSLIEHLGRYEEGLHIADVCYTSTARRALNRFRISVTASTISDLRSGLERAECTEAPSHSRPTVFLFGGQGSQYLGMGRELMTLSPIFRKTVLECHELLLAWGFPGCLSVIEPQGPPQDHRHPSTVRSFQSAVYVIEVAIARVLDDLGIQPSMVTGHSLGEFAALAVAGVIDVESGLWLVAERARLIVEKCKLWETSMLAVNMPAKDVRKTFLSLERYSWLEISCENSPFDCVVGGDADALKELKDQISNQYNKRCLMLEVPVAYHTAALRPILPELEVAASQIHLAPPTISIASNALGRVVEPGEDVFTPKYFVDHCYKTVAFDRGIADILRKNEETLDGTWIEIGPHPTLLPMAAPHLSSGNPDKLPTLKKGQHASRIISDLLCAVYRGTTDNGKLRRYFENAPAKAKMVDLPVMPMEKRNFYVSMPREPPPANAQTTHAEQTPFSLLHKRVDGSDSTAFETPIEALSELIQGHIVCGRALCPASVYTEMAVAAATMSRACADDEILKLTDLNFVRPLLYSEGSGDTVRIAVSQENDTQSEQNFEFTSVGDQQDPSTRTIHCTGKVKRQSLSKMSEKLGRTEHALKKRRAQFDNDNCQTFSTSVMYNKIFSRVVEYSAHYRAVRKIHLDDAFEEIYAQCELPTADENVRYAGHPILLDTMLHVAGFAANLDVENDMVCIAHRVHSISMARQEIPSRHTFEVHCSNFQSPIKPDCILADVHAVDEEGVIAVIKGIEFHRSKLEKIRAVFEYASQNTAQNSARTLSHSPNHSKSPRQSISGEHRFLSRGPCGAESVQTSVPSRRTTPSNATLYSILSETTGVEGKDITPRTELSAMGVDSMMVFELEKRLKDVIDPKPTVSEISACSTVEDMENLVSARMSPSTSPSTKPSDICGASRKSSLEDPHDLERIDSAFEPNPEIPIRSNMIELVRERLGYREQPEQIQSGTNSPLYLFAPGADPCLLVDLEDDWPSINKAAQHYATMIRDHQKRNYSKQDSVVLGGWSFGGIIAFETACLLADDDDCRIHGVVLIDAPPPFNHTPIAQETIEAAMAYTQKQNSHPRPKSVTDFEDAIAALTIRNNLRRAALLSEYKPSRVEPMPQTVLLRSSEGLYIPNAHNLPDNRWLHDRSDVGVSVDAWEELIGRRLEVIDIPGDHFHPFETANVKGTTAAINKACKMLER